MWTRLRELGAPIYGDKKTLYARLQKYEADKKSADDTRAYLEARRDRMG